MTGVYYRTADGGIRHYHEVPPEKLDDLEALEERYNETMMGKEECHVVEFEDDSFEAELFNRACDLDDAMDRLDELKDALSCALETVTGVTDLYR